MRMHMHMDNVHRTGHAHARMCMRILNLRAVESLLRTTKSDPSMLHKRPGGYHQGGLPSSPAGAHRSDTVLQAQGVGLREGAPRGPKLVASITGEALILIRWAVVLQHG